MNSIVEEFQDLFQTLAKYRKTNLEFRYYGKEKKFRNSKSLKLSCSVAVAVLLVIALTIYPTSKANNATAINKTGKKLSTTKAKNQASNTQSTKLQDITAIPNCWKSIESYGGYASFECEALNSTKIHFEYFPNVDELFQASDRFSLEDDELDNERKIRVGQLEGNARLLGIDPKRLLLINIVSKYSEADLRIWWADYKPNQNTELQNYVSTTTSTPEIIDTFPPISKQN